MTVRKAKQQLPGKGNAPTGPVLHAPARPTRATNHPVSNAIRAAHARRGARAKLRSDSVRVASGVHAVQRKSEVCERCAGSGSCTACGGVQLKAAAHAGAVAPTPSVAPAGGQPISTQLADDLGGRLGQSVDDAILHTDGAAAEAARSLGAQAFTAGDHIYFGGQRYQPYSHRGRELLVHELVHFLQQRPTGRAAARSSGELELEADAVAAEVAAGASIAPGRISLGAAIRGTSQRRDADDIDLDLEALDTLRQDITDAEAEVAERFAPMLLGNSTATMEQKMAVWGEQTALEREMLLVDAIDDIVTGELSEKPVTSLIAEAEAAAKTEVATIAFFMTYKLDFDAAVLEHPMDFPEVTMALFDSIVEGFETESNHNYNQFEIEMQALLGRDKKELAQLFLEINDSSQLASIANQYEYTASLPMFAPGFIQQRWEANELKRPADLQYVVKTQWESKLPAFPEPFTFLGEMLSHWYAYHLLDFLKQRTSEQRVALQFHVTPWGNMLAPGAGILPVLKQTFGATPIRIDPTGIGSVSASGSLRYFWGARGGNGYFEIFRRMHGVLDAWVLGMSWWERMRLAMGLYDLWGKVGKRLEALVSFKVLLAVIGFTMFIIGIQFIPFVNVIVDAILLYYFGAKLLLEAFDLLYDLVVLDADCDQATGFLDIWRASKVLSGADEGIVDVLITLLLWGGGKLYKYAKYGRKKPSLASVDEVAAEDVIKDGPGPVRKAAKKASGAKHAHDAWEEGLDAESREALEANEDLANAYREMDPEVRKAFTQCGSTCIPIKPPPTAEDISRVEELLAKTKVKGDHPGLREYLHVNRNRLSEAIDDLAGVGSKADLDAFLERQIVERAVARGGSARRGKNGRWEFRKAPESPPVTEYTVQPHGQQPGTDSFFQSHHGVQGAWARERKIPGYNYEEQPAILLRDSRKGTPHEIVNSRQQSRAADIAERTYADERKLMTEDMDAAGVPKDAAKDLLDQTDAYFGKLYNSSTSLSPAELEELFGTWKPGKK